jgi:Ala-tRNA(Pro) deacylase
MEPSELLAFLTRLGVAHRTVEHPPLFTVEQSKALRVDLPGGHTKNLFLRNRKGRMWLVTCHEDQAVDLKTLAIRLEAGRFSFASPERLMRYLGIAPGAVSPFALVNDNEGLVRFVMDRALMDYACLNLHPLSNAMTTSIAPGDLARFLAEVGHATETIDFTSL